MAALGYTSATATTNPPATVIGSDGTLQYAAHNLAAKSNALNVSPWISSNFSVSQQTGTMPDGSTGTYWRLTATSTNAVLYQTATVASGVTCTTGIWIRRVSGVGFIQTILPGNGGVTKTISAQWQRYSDTGAAAGTSCYMGVFAFTSGDVIEVCQQQANLGAVLLPDYVDNTTTAPVYAAPITYDRGASSNAITYSDVWQSGTWIANVSPTDGGAGALIDGYQTARFTASGGASGYFRAIAGSPIPSGETFWVAHYVNRVSGAGTFTGGCDALGSLVFNPSTGQLTSGPAVSGVKAVAGGWLIFGKYTGNGTANSLVAFGGSAATVFDVATWVVRGASLTPYLKTGPTAPLYTAGTPKSQNLASGSGTQSVTVLPGCVYSILHQSGGTYTLSGAATGTTTAGTTTTFVAATATLTLTASSTPTLLQVWEGTGTMAYVAGPYSLYYQQGLITEAARTRETLHPRDLTQAAWVKSGMTAAKTATGLDGVANSCTTLTATVGSGAAVVYQTITSASANRAMSARVRARSAATVSGTIGFGGVANTAFVATPQWRDIYFPFAAVTNPAYAIWLNNIGDSIDVDFVQGEQYTTLPAVPPMPIWGTESAAQSKSADLVIGPAGLVSTAGPQTTVVRCTPSSANNGANQAILARGGAGLVLFLHGGATEAGAYDGTNQVYAAASVVSGVPMTIGSRYGGSALSVSLNGGTVATGSFDGSMNTGGAIGIGHDGVGGSPFSGLIGSIEIANSAFSDANLQLASLGLLA